MNNKKIFTLFLLIVTVLLSGCSNNEGNKALETGTYLGKKSTYEMIEVNSSDEWIIKDQYKNDENYVVASIIKTDENIGEYPLVKIVAKEIIGNIRTSFAKREGRNYIIIQDKDENKIYFRSIGDGNKDSITQNIMNKKDKKDTDNYIKSIANYVFIKQ